MKNIVVNDDYNLGEIIYHPKIKGVQIIKGKNNFPISWLNTQGYCEYSLYLDNFEGIEVEDTFEMKKGTKEHKRLENEFKKDAVEGTIEEVVELSSKEEVITREMFIVSPEFGIRGLIDEIRFTPDFNVIIDDKPGNRAYNSSINQVLAYCLAFKEHFPEKKIYGALRERGTSNIFWYKEFDENQEKQIKFQIDRMQGLIDGTKPFVPTKNPNKCNKCRFSDQCIHSQVI